MTEVEVGNLEATVCDQATVCDLPPAAVCVVVMSDGGRVLSVTDRQTGKLHGFPGGKVEPCESPEDAAVRELLEETGLVATSLELVYDGNAGHYNVSAYYAASWIGTPRRGDAGPVEWVDWEKMVSPEHSKWPVYNAEVRGRMPGVLP